MQEIERKGDEGNEDTEGEERRARNSVKVMMKRKGRGAGRDDDLGYFRSSHCDPLALQTDV